MTDDVKKLTKYYKISFRTDAGLIRDWGTWSDAECTQVNKIINIVTANGGTVLRVELVEEE